MAMALRDGLCEERSRRPPPLVIRVCVGCVLAVRGHLPVDLRLVYHISVHIMSK